jgi:hypothetical protein
MPIDPLLLGGLMVIAIIVVIVMVRQRGQGVTTIRPPSSLTPSSGAPSIGDTLPDDLVGQVHTLLAGDTGSTCASRPG